MENNNYMETANYIIAFATVAYVVVSYFLWKTTNDSLKLNRKIFQSSNRPFIGFESCEIHFTGENMINPFIRYCNFGNLPAKDVSINVSYNLDETKSVTKFYPIELSNIFPNKSSAWGDVLTTTFKKTSLTKDSILNLEIQLKYKSVDEAEYKSEQYYKYNYQEDKFILQKSNWN